MIHSEATKQKLSQMRKGHNNPFYGHHHTEETKQKISQRVSIFNSQRQYQIQPTKIKIPEGDCLAYLAGFCDADGSIRFVKMHGKPRPFVAFYNSNVEVITWIKSVLGHASIQKHNKGRELVQSVRVDAANDVYALTLALLPFLIVKRQDALKVINFLENKYGSRLLARKEQSAHGKN